MPGVAQCSPTAAIKRYKEAGFTVEHIIAGFETPRLEAVVKYEENSATASYAGAAAS